MSETVTKSLDEMSMAELWSVAKLLGVPKDGKKEELVARIKQAQEDPSSIQPKVEKSSAEPVEAVYIAKYHELKLVMNPSYLKEVGGRIITVAGRGIQFHDGLFKTSKPEEIEYLDSHPNNGSIFRKISRDDVKGGKSVEQIYKEKFQSLEEREKAVAAKEAALEKKEIEMKGFSEGAPQQKVKTGIRSSEDQPKF